MNEEKGNHDTRSGGVERLPAMEPHGAAGITIQDIVSGQNLQYYNLRLV